MDGTAAIQSAFAGAHNWYLGTVADITSDHANTVPPGIGHPVGALMAHILNTEDFMFNTLIQGKPTLWERDGWGAKLGCDMLVEQQATAARAYTCEPQQLAPYAQAVFENTDAYLSSIADSDLDRELDMVAMGFPQNMPLGAFLTQMLLGNTYAHTGEISALKGTMSMKGFPF